MKQDHSRHLEASDAPSGLRDAACSPLSAADLYCAAVAGNPIPANRVLATFAEASNWVQIYHGEASPATDYKAKACEWAFVGPSRPPYELAQWAIQCLQTSPNASEIKRNIEPELTGEPGGRSGVGSEFEENTATMAGDEIALPSVHGSAPRISE